MNAAQNITTKWPFDIQKKEKNYGLLVVDPIASYLDNQQMII